MRLLVTGGAGFIGSHLVRRVVDEPCVDLVVNLDCLTYAGDLARLQSVNRHPKYRLELVDIRDSIAVREVFGKHGITHVLHLAAESHVDRSIAGPDDFVQTNIVGTYHLLEACRAFWESSLQNRRFLQVSTDEVFGSLESGTWHEQSAYAPNSPYAATKAAGDLLVRSYFRTYGLPVLITNCSNNYGPCQNAEKLIPHVVECILQKKPIPVYGDGRNIRDWLHVHDHVEALWQVLNRGTIGESYNICGGNEWTNLDLVHLLCDICEQKESLPAGSARALIQFVPDRPGHDLRYAMDATKIQSELGWTPQQQFREGLQSVVRSVFETKEACQAKSLATTT